MDLELLQLAVKSLSTELSELKTELLTLRAELREMKRNRVHELSYNRPQTTAREGDELLTLLAARKILKIGRNGFLALVKNGLITPIRMNLRTIRYSRIDLQRYIEEHR